MDADAINELRAEMLADRETQVEILDEHGADIHSDTVKDIGVSSSGFSDAGQQAEERSEVLGSIETARTRVHQIDTALERIDEGTYGVCVDCGNEIPQARLEVRPLSVRCVECAAKHEDR
ncbi:TraR/DksA family transcriptional regulator [Salsipaludibacter albus]|uniref:TraR/DksA family transcriptional regulator n=1 Tax=Salsipaludibacter albus TaxID=2849650 RepID=UPI001EE40341|nr:TraR/DksA family transcriptional regulator [Salsipaludibacter albus]MBY5164190.1 TraR/DksA family transcriptional regulator [Salsipaludibacter albus]